jgi:hypothetical protein
LHRFWCATAKALVELHQNADPRQPGAAGLRETRWDVPELQRGRNADPGRDPDWSERQQVLAANPL